MILIVNKSFDTYFNMAAEEYFLDRCVDDVLMFWQNSNTIVVGKNQNTLSEIDSDFVKEKGINVVRRLTGGGAMYQDAGNLNFTFICNNSSEWYNDFSRFTGPVIKALSALGINAESSGRNDITVNGRKISGNAQTVRNGRLMHHGTLLLESNVDVLSKALRPDREKIKSKAIASVSSRVANINEFSDKRITCSDLIAEIKKTVKSDYPDITDYVLTKEDIEAIERLAKEKYSTWEWNYGYSPKYDFSKKLKFSSGIVQTFLKVENGTISDAKIYGDFFGISEIADMEEALVGVRHNPDDISKIIEKFDLNLYITGISFDELMHVLY